MDEKLEIRNYEELNSSLNNADLILKRAYLSKMQDNSPEDYERKELSELSEDVNNVVRLVRLEKIVFNKNENLQDKLVSVYKSVANLEASFLLLINGDETQVEFYFGTKSDDLDNVSDADDVLENSLCGNFPGLEKSLVRKSLEKKQGLKKILSFLDDAKYVSAVSAIPALRSEKEDKEHEFIQGIEKFIDIMRGKKYSMLLIADSKKREDIEISRRALEDLYSGLVPFSRNTYSFEKNGSDSLSQSNTEGVAHTINKTLTETLSHTTGSSHTESKTIAKNVSSALGASMGAVDSLSVGRTLGENSSGGFALIGFGSWGSSLATTAGVAAANFLAKSVGLNLGLTKANTSADTESNSDTESASDAHGTADTSNKSKTDGKTKTEGFSNQIQVEFENCAVKKLMERIESQLKRYDRCADLGIWNCATYFLSESPNLSAMAASTYQSLICGENSSLENDYIINWNNKDSDFVKQALLHFEHPVFEDAVLGKITPGTLVSSAELAIAASLPKHSVPGLSVLECAEFGRNVSKYDLPQNESTKLALGKIFHMNHEESLEVKLDANSLCSHTFIAGSTGTGKSNTIYKILQEAQRCETKFLVIEPAKGEYKNIFGGNANVKVFGTNPNFAPLLRLNPFSFDCEHILVHEHIDRLVSIFNVCWPMYAAMPAVLKEAIEKSYADAGWDLENPFAENKYDKSYFPTFADVARNIRTIIDSSEYDAENKGAYKGSLLTRLTSLTNGINGMIFTNKEIGNEKLFDENTIVDLSRIGSAETKSLIMGILVMKLQEYRMASDKMNAGLQHITVLEEAHNLLKRVPVNVSAESANLQGRSVEMLANAIAEMRTYGEGFIIADQAPGLLDLSAIRNTNTKIIMRLPDFDDRQLVGKSANLNDDQINELAKLPCGVAAIYQNEWVQAVLCKVEKFKDDDKKKFEHDSKQENCGNGKDELKQRIKIAKLLCNCDKLPKLIALKELAKITISGAAKARAVELLENPSNDPKMTKIAPVMSALFPKTKLAAVQSYASTKQVENWTADVEAALKNEIACGNELPSEIDEQVRRDIVQSIITDHVYNEMKNILLLEKWHNEGGLK